MELLKKINGLLQQKGRLGFLKYLSARIASRIVAIPIFFVIICVSPFIRIRVIKLFPSRIGHYSFNTEAILCGIDLNLDKDKRQKIYFYTLPGDQVCNEQLHAMWKRVITIFHHSYLAVEVDKLLQRFGRHYHRLDVLKKTFEPGGDGRDRWGLLSKVNKCHLSFTPDEHQQAKKLIAALGVPHDKPFICLLVRDSLYLDAFLPSCNWSYHDYRDADISSYQLGAKWLADQGYYVIRMGKVVKDPFHTNHPNIIDYAQSELRSDFLDMYLSAHCFFFISTCTGLDSIARVFRKPFLVTNLGLPDFDIWHPWDLFIPKKILNIHSGKCLTFKEMKNLYKILSSKKTINQLLDHHGLRLIDNTDEEIKSVIHEMVSTLEGNRSYTQEDEELQKKFWQVFPRYLLPPNLPTLPLPTNEFITMRVGTAFLKANLSLLNDELLPAEIGLPLHGVPGRPPEVFINN